MKLLQMFRISGCEAPSGKNPSRRVLGNSGLPNRVANTGNARSGANAFTTSYLRIKRTSTGAPFQNASHGKAPGCMGHRLGMGSHRNGATSAVATPNVSMGRWAQRTAIARATSPSATTTSTPGSDWKALISVDLMRRTGV